MSMLWASLMFKKLDITDVIDVSDVDIRDVNDDSDVHVRDAVDVDDVGA